MRISLHSSSVLHAATDTTLAEVQRAAAAGLSGYWAPMLGGLDTLTVLAAAGGYEAGLELGTAVVPIPLRTPYALAQQATTVQALTGGRLALGLGTSHPALVREVFRSEWKPPLETMKAYLDELLPMLAAAAGAAPPPVTAVPPILLGALNPGMARLAARYADGVVTWAAGPRTVEEVVLPAVAERASDRPFRIIVALPLAITDDTDATRARVQRRYGANDEQPSYRKVREREGGQGITDLAIVGGEEVVTDRLAELAALGVTEFAAHSVATPADEERTWAFLTHLARSRNTGATAPTFQEKR